MHPNLSGKLLLNSTIVNWSKFNEMFTNQTNILQREKKPPTYKISVEEKAL